jgi:hypothetical protein
MSKPGFPITMRQVGTVHNSYKPWNGPTGTGTDTIYRDYRFEDKSGTNTPGWPHAIRTNPYLRSVFTWSQKPLTVSGTVNQGDGHFDQFFGEWGNAFGLDYNPWIQSGNPFSLDAEVASVRSHLVNKIISNIQQNRVQLGELYETRSQTASMVASTAKRLAGAFTALKRGNPVGAARELLGADYRSRGKIRSSRSGQVTSGVGGIPEQWLALQYGWKPLLQDVYNSCETVHKAWNDNGEAMTAHASSNASGDHIIISRPRQQPHGPSFRVESSSRKVHGSASVTYGVSSSIGSSLSQLGVTNPASLAWELLPYSFVVDWFIPIGSFLENLDYHRGLSFSHGYITIVSSQEVKMRIDSGHAVSGSIVADWFGGDSSGRAYVMTREALSSFPPPPPPQFKDPFSLTHVANGLSLLATAFRGGKTPR